MKNKIYNVIKLNKKKLNYLKKARTKLINDKVNILFIIFIYSLSACNLRLWQLYNKYNFLKTILNMLKQNLIFFSFVKNMYCACLFVN